MTATDAMIATVRRMVAETKPEPYSNELITAFIENHPLIDVFGEEPIDWDYSTEPPTPEWNDKWVPTYDLNAAAADIWEEKAAAYAGDFDFRADGGDYKRSQIYLQMSALARKFRSKRSVKGITQFAFPKDARRDSRVN